MENPLNTQSFPAHLCKIFKDKLHNVFIFVPNCMENFGYPMGFPNLFTQKLHNVFPTWFPDMKTSGKHNVFKSYQK